MEKPGTAVLLVAIGPYRLLQSHGHGVFLGRPNHQTSVVRAGLTIVPIVPSHGAPRRQGAPQTD